MYRKRKTKKKNVQIMLLCCLAAALMPVPTGCGSQSGLYVSRQENNDTAEAPATQKGTEEEEQAEQNGSAAEDRNAKEGAVAEIYVQVSGAVVNPGVYSLPEGSRIFEAVELAGGVTEQADVKTLNQAQVLKDGQMVYVYAVGEQKAAEQGAAEEDGRVNLNTASAEQLMTLPGIGQSKAEAIISWREEHGAFEKIEDIMNITGIKEGVFSKIKDQIKVN